MTVAFDASFLLYLFAPAGQVGAPLGPDGKPIAFAKERVQALFLALEEQKTKIVIPTPALSEVMVRSGVEAGQSYIAIMAKKRVFRIAPFDEKSAIELPIMYGLHRRGEALKQANEGTYAKIKYDRQIVAIAFTEGCSTIYTDDENQAKFAMKQGMAVIGLADCPIPTDAAQIPLKLEGEHGQE